MRKIVLTFGIIAGLVVATLMLISMSMMNLETDYKMAEVVGYASIIVSLSTIFFGIRAYRDKELDGFITFGKAFKVGLFITLIASVLYTTTWMIYSTFISPETMNEMFQAMVTQIQNSGESQAAIQQQLQEMNEMKEMFMNPFIQFFVVMLEIFPIGLIISLICAAILRKKPAATEGATA